jgi:hypothetical protein
MYATVRRYEGIDKVRSKEIMRKVVDNLVSNISELPGFIGYVLIDAGAGAAAASATVNGFEFLRASRRARRGLALGSQQRRSAPPARASRPRASTLRPRSELLSRWAHSESFRAGFVMVAAVAWTSGAAFAKHARAS